MSTYQDRTTEDQYAAAPVNYEAEQALLGALLGRNEAYDRVVDIVKAEHFADEAHAEIFRACVKLIDRGERASPITLKGYFDRYEALEAVGGSKYLAQLAASTVTLVNAADYARTVKDLYLAREAIAIGEDLVARAWACDLDRTAETELGQAVESIYRVLEDNPDAGGRLDPVSARLEGALKQIEEAHKAARDGGASGLSTGLRRLDRKIGGLKPGKLYVVAGRSSMGKSALAEGFCWSCADQAGTAALFSLEMTAEDVVQRQVSRATGIDSDLINNGHLGDAEWQRIFDARGRIGDAKVHVDDSAQPTVASMRARARRLQRRQGLDLVVIDYLQLMGGDRTADRNRAEELGQITRQIKTRIAKDLAVPVVLLSQLNRAVESRDDKRPRLSDLRESGAIEQDADVVMFIYREAYYLKQEQPQQKAGETEEKFNERTHHWQERLSRVAGRAEIIVAKQRNGPTGSTVVEFDGPRMRFHEDNLAGGGLI